MVEQGRGRKRGSAEEVTGGMAGPGKLTLVELGIGASAVGAGYGPAKILAPETPLKTREG